MQWRDDARDAAGTICPVLLIAEWRSLFTADAFLQHGVLPCSGGWAQQHPMFVDGVEIIARVRSQLEEERARQMSVDQGG